MKKLRTAVFTSSRSEYGLLKPLLKLMADDKEFELLLLVGGGHLSNLFGYTKTDIEADKFPIAAEFDFLAEPPEGDYLTKSLAKLQEQIGSWLYNNKPDWIVVLGDRFELLAVAAAALLHKIPLAHISGGDITVGAIDNQVRHAVSKIAAVHFPATEAAKDTLLALGEEQWRICLAGEPGLDQIADMNYLPKEDLFKQLGLDTKLPVALMTFHPDTLINLINPDFIKTVINNLISKHNMQVMATGSNFDEGGAEINKAIELMNNPLCKFTMSLGQKRYYSMLKYAALVIGNSSSGIVEAQSFKIPVINVGSRQQDRLSNPNVIHVAADINAIDKAIPKALSAEFSSRFSDKINVYGDGKACQRIINFLKRIPRENLLQKR